MFSCVVIGCRRSSVVLRRVGRRCAQINRTTMAWPIGSPLNVSSGHRFETHLPCFLSRDVFQCICIARWCLSVVHHRSKFYRNGWTDRAVCFCSEATVGLSYFSVDVLCRFSPLHVDRRKCYQRSLLPAYDSTKGNFKGDILPATPLTVYAVSLRVRAM